MLETQTAMTCYFLPDDRVLLLQALVDLIDSARPTDTYRQIMYGFTNAELVDAILRAYARGTDCKLILDHSQSTGPAEVAQLHRMLLAGFPADNIRIGTSTQHQIIHMKCATVSGADVPDGQFATWRDARAAGYPVSVEGSFNWSGTAAQQMNTSVWLPSRPYSAYMRKVFDAQWAWLTANEPQYDSILTSGSAPEKAA